MLVAVIGWAGLAAGTQPNDTYQSTVGGDKPVADYQFADSVGSSTIADSAGANTASNSGITLGGEEPFAGGKSGVFGGEAYATLTSNPLAGASEFTAEAWVKWSGATNYNQPIFDFGSSTTTYIMLTPSSTQTGHPMMAELDYVGFPSRVIATKLTANVWKYVAVTETSENNLTLYVNGEAVGTSSSVSWKPSSLGTLEHNYFGRGQGTEAKFAGSLSNVAFYTTALTAKQILAHYNAAEFPVNTVTPTITGTAKDESALTAHKETWTGLPTITFAYEWQRCNTSGAACIAAGGAEEKYAAQHEDVGHTLRVAVTGTNSAGKSTATSAATSTVAATAPVNTELPAISGTAADGKVLTASHGSWKGTPPTYKYQWRLCSSTGASCTNIAEATEPEYRLVTSQIGHTVRVVVTAKNGAGEKEATSTASAVITSGPPVNRALPGISGEAKDGKTLSASTGTWVGTTPITYTYRWRLCNSEGASCSNIEGSAGEGSSHALSSSAVGHTLDVVASATNSVETVTATSAATAVVAAIPPASTALPTISGEAKDGKTLSASTGSWTGSTPLSYSYQWRRCNTAGEACADISGATEARYTLGHSDVGSTVRVKVTATNAGGSATATSSANSPVAALAPSNTTHPTISGEAKDGHTLSSSSGEWSGTPTISYTYQWQRCNEKGEGCANIGGATSASYLLGHEDIGSTVRVSVTATNTGGSASSDSEMSAVVVAVAPSDTAPPTISGLAKLGHTLEAGSGTWSGTPTIAYAYQWERCNALGEGCLPISGATATTHLVTSEDANATLRVTVTASNAGGSASASSTTTEEIAGVPPSNTKAPSISGSAIEGATLTASEGTWEGLLPLTFSYQWQRCNASSECTAIAPATGRTYVPVAADVGNSLEVTVTAENGAGKRPATSASTALVPPEPPLDTSLPAISGTAEQGHSLTATSGSWTGTRPSFAYQWQRCNASGEACQALVGATSSVYVLGPGDVESTLRVRVTATTSVSSASALSAATSVVGGDGAEAPASTAAPTVVGVPQTGQPLSTTTGSWSGTAPIAYSYSWQRCNEGGGECVAIEGAQGSEYVPVTQDEGSTLRVVVTASGPGGWAEARSAASTTVRSGAPSEFAGPTISGSPAVGQALTAQSGEWSDGEFQYQWERCDEAGGECSDIPAATSVAYVPQTTDASRALRVRVTSRDTDGSVTALSSPTTPIQPATALINTWPATISGTPQVGAVLTANQGSWVEAEEDAFAYRWQSCDADGASCENIVGATGPTYTVEGGLVGRAVRVVVTAETPEATLEASGREVSAITQPIAGEGAPVVEAPPTIAGTGLEGFTIHATRGTWVGEGPIAYTYQWEHCNEGGQSCSPISGATTSGYTLGASDAGSSVRLVVTATNAHGVSEAVSAPVIAASTAPASHSIPEITGHTEPGSELEIEPGLWTGSGVIALSYEWQRCNEHGESCTTIAEASGATYKAVSADSSHALRAVVTATSSAGSATAASLPTSPIGTEASAPENLEPPEMSGSLTAGALVTANPGTWSGTDPISYAYQWQRCSAGGEACTNIEGATAGTYRLVSANVKSQLRLAVVASNTVGSATATSIASEAVVAAGPPTNTSAPKIAGPAIEGQLLFAENGGWTGSQPLTYYYQWERCNHSGEGCGDIEGATKASYLLTAADLASTVRVVVTTRNSLGTAGAISAPTAAVAPPVSVSAESAVKGIEHDDPSLLASSTTAQIEEESLQPSLQDPGEQLSASHVLTNSTTSKTTPGEFAVESSYGELEITPIGTAGDASPMPTLVNGAAALFTEIWTNSDAVVRPNARGATTVLQLRSAEAPTSFSWRVSLGAHLRLERLSNGSVAVVEPPAGALTAPLGEEGRKEPAPAETSPKAGGEGVSASGADEERNDLADEAGGSLPSVPTLSTGAVSPRESELQPQETLANYERDQSAMASAETSAAYPPVLLLEAPKVLDAEGSRVPASLSVSGDKVTLTFTPSLSAHYPVAAELPVVAPTDALSEARDPATYGISDEKYAAITSQDAGLQKPPLNIGVARDLVPYYIWAHDPTARGELEAWLGAVRAAGLKPYITVEAGFQSGNRCATVKHVVHCPRINIGSYKTDVEELMTALTPDPAPGVEGVLKWGAWNEPDLEDNNPLYNDAAEAADLWKVMSGIATKLGCACEIAAGEFAEDHHEYIKKYKETIHRDPAYSSAKPEVWGLHDYKDLVYATEHHEKGQANPELSQFLSEIRSGGIWLSEQGVQLRQFDDYPTRLGAGIPSKKQTPSQLQIAAADDFEHLATGHARVQLVVYYGVVGPTNEEIHTEKEGFDSALVPGPEVVEKQKPREAYCVLVENRLHGCPPPKVKGGKPTKVAMTAVTVSGLVNPEELPTQYAVEYGTTTAYGSKTSMSELPNPTGEQPAAAGLVGLAKCTTYHYRLIAENEASQGNEPGTVTPTYGSDKTFTTACHERLFIKVVYEVKEEGPGLYAEGLPLVEGATNGRVRIVSVGKLENEFYNAAGEGLGGELLVAGTYPIPAGELGDVAISTPEVDPYEVGGLFDMTGSLGGEKSVTLHKYETLNHSPCRFEFFYSYGW